jgi:hypothetical protein
MANTEKTFRFYTSDQGKCYAQNRLDYHQDLYNLMSPTTLQPAVNLTP